VTGYPTLKDPRSLNPVSKQGRSHPLVVDTQSLGVKGLTGLSTMRLVSIFMYLYYALDKSIALIKTLGVRARAQTSSVP
jgi:hypothetical protein